MCIVTTVVVPLKPEMVGAADKSFETKQHKIPQKSVVSPTFTRMQANMVKLREAFFYNFYCKCTKVMSWKDRVTKKMPTHRACRHNERCPGHPGRNRHSGMGVTRTHSHLSHSVAL